MFKQFSAAITVLLASGIAHAQDRSRPQPAPQPSALAECVHIEEGERRLACYDRIARREAPAPAPQQAPAGDLAQWSGNGMTTTRPFRADGPWELKWEASGNIFQVFLYRAGEVHGQAMPNIVANQMGSGPGSSYVPRGGEYYLVVNAMGRWNMRATRVE